MKALDILFGINLALFYLNWRAAAGVEPARVDERLGAGVSAANLGIFW
jgi:hypothetical protein